MKSKLFLSVTISSSLLALTSCKNPADETTDAQVGEAAPAATAAGGTSYAFTKNSTIGFTGSKVTGSHSGSFEKFEGSFVVKDKKPVSGEFTIEMGSTISDSEKLTRHLKSADFFDVPQFSTTQFVVTEFTKKGEQGYDLSGNLTLHGVTKNITFPTQVEVANDLIKVKAQFDIKRQDFGISYPGKKDDLIRDEVIIKLNLEAKPS